jgi:hypothetical protein
MFPIASNSESSSESDSTLYVDDVFSTHLYTGTGTTQNINNGIDLASKGGMVWIKDRSRSGKGHVLFDTNVYNSTVGRYFLTPSGTDSGLIASTAGATDGVLSTGINYTSSGFTLGTDTAYSVNNYYTADNYVSWTFRKAAKFFDVVTWTSTNSSTQRTISHNLGITPGMVIIKSINTNTNSYNEWYVAHRYNLTAQGYLNQSYAFAAGVPIITAWTDTTVTFAANFNEGSGNSYIVYLYAHDTSSTGIIQCGSFTTNSSTDSFVSLGWEPQYVLVKNTAVGGWILCDSMRGMPVGSADAYLMPNSANAESTSNDYINPSATGFYPTWFNLNTTSTYIYMAIRRPNKPPTTSTQVFKPYTYTETISGEQNVGFTPDMGIQIRRSGETHILWDRLRGNTATLSTDNTAAENGVYSGVAYPFGGFTNNGFISGFLFNNTAGALSELLCFKRAPGFFDVVCYKGTSTNTTQAHNLTVVPELMIVKCRNNGNTLWSVYNSTLGATKALDLSSTAIPVTSSAYWNNTTPTASIFTLGTISYVNESPFNYVAYLFATLAGISKVGSYTGNGSSQNINCGFSSKYSAFVLIKRTDSTGDWYVWDTARGITTTNEPHLSLNTTAADVTTDNSVDLATGGFTVIQNSATNINVSNATYIYLSIASGISLSEAVFTTPGATNWTCPAGVTLVCVVCVGGGSTSSWNSGYGYASGGGGLGWKNNIAVTPGQVYSVVVGSGSGDRSVAASAGNSYFINLATVAGLGGSSGESGSNGNGGGFVGDGGGNGGHGGSQVPNEWAGGGGAGGYSGTGGTGGNGGGSGTAGSGGAGGGGSGGFQGGGGVGLYGQGTNGAGGGGGGSNGISASSTTGGLYGGGGAVSGAGGGGAVRIIWGTGRSFPSNAA